MAVCPTWTYRNVTPSVFKSLQSVAKKKGFSIPNSPKGRFTISVSAFNVGFAYAWDSRSATLLISCETKPALLGCSTIKSFADQIIVESGGKIG